MRTAPILAAALALLAAPALAQSQSGTTIKAEGAAGAGVCAGALDLTAGMAAREDGANALRVTNMQRARDFFAELPAYPQAEITANAEAFVRLMQERIEKAESDAVRAAVTREIVGLARGCFENAKRHVPMVAAVPPGARPAQPGQAAPAQPARPAQPQPEPQPSGPIYNPE